MANMTQQENRKPLVILSGATAVGKTELSIHLAQRINGSIISADSMQVYKGFDIGTAKITQEQMQGVPHYLIDELEPDESFNVFEFQKRCLDYMEKIYAQGRIPVLTGGTGFYIQSVLYGICFTDSETDQKYRTELELLAKEKGPSYLHEMLQKADPEAARQIHANNVKRVIRALEFYRETGQQISVHNEQERRKESPYNYAYFVLNRDRKLIYERINRRVDEMIGQGLVQEVQGLLDRGISPDSLAMQGLGYKEIVSYLRQQCTLEEAVSLLKQRTRHFAKRQITWFKREKDVIWMDYERFPDTEQMENQMYSILKEKKIV